MPNLSERIKTERERLGLTQTDLARSAGCGQSLIGNLESGSQQSSAKLPQIAAALGVSAMWLATGRGDRAPEEVGLSRKSPEPPTYNRSATKSLFDLARELERGDLPPEVEALLKAELDAKSKFVRAALARFKKNEGKEEQE